MFHHVISDNLKVHIKLRVNFPDSFAVAGTAVAGVYGRFGLASSTSLKSVSKWLVHTSTGVFLRITSEIRMESQQTWLPFDSLVRAEHYRTYRLMLRFDAQVWGPTTKIQLFIVTQNQNYRASLPKPSWFQKYTGWAKSYWHFCFRFAITLEISSV